MIQIDFFDKDIVSTLLPISTTRPDKVVFLIDKRNITGRDPENVTRAIKNMLPETEVEFQPVTVDDLADIYNKMREVLNGIEDLGDVCIDLTGGTELMSACGYRISKELDILAIYVDVRREHVINAETGEVISPVKHISLEDCLMAIGAKRLKDSHDLPDEEEYARILGMSEIIFANIEDWSKLCQHIANTVSTSGQRMTFRLNDRIGRTKNGTRALVQGFMDKGFLERTDGKTRIGRPGLEILNELGKDDRAQNSEDFDGNEFGKGAEAGAVGKGAETSAADKYTDTIDGEYRFTSKKAREYITTYGTWLELYVYIKALEVYDEAAIGVVIDWYDGDHIDTQDNEIDVVAMRRSIPIFISCKMRKPVSGDLYEVGFVASRLGGSRAKAILATTYPVKEMGTSPKRMYQRMKKLRVGLIEAERFSELPAADVFNHATQMTE